jgi:hypothetical protein
MSSYHMGCGCRGPGSVLPEYDVDELVRIHGYSLL